MNVISKIYLCLLPLTAFACQRQPIDGVAAGASGGAIAATSRRPVEVADAPLADYQRELLLLAFDAASKFPSVPHSKNRGRAQDLVVSACFRMNQPMLALSFAPRVEGYYQAVAYADFAWCCAKAGDAKRTKDYVKLAEVALKSENDDANAQEWRTDKVRIKIARALATLGEHAKAQEVLGKVSAASTGAVDAGWTGTMAERVAAMQLVDS